MKIIITIEVPGNADVQFGESGVTASLASSLEPTYVPPFEDELIPLPAGATPIPGDPPQPTAFRAPTLAQHTSICPVHLKPWKTVPAGISKKTGQPYAAFAACQERGCDQRPA